MSKTITVIGVIFTIYSLILCLFSNLNIGVFLTLAIGLFILFLGIFYEKIKFLTSRGFLKIVKIMVIILFCIEFLFLCFIATYGYYDNITYTEDAVIVLGAGIRGDKVTLPLKLRLDKAIDYHRENPDALIVLTGGKGFQETVTEAYAMEKYLVSQGVNKDIIIKEEQATSTAENMKYSKEILDTHFNNSYKTVVITNNFHIFRAVTLAKKAGFENIFHTHAGLQWYNLLPCYLRESLAILKMSILD